MLNLGYSWRRDRLYVCKEEGDTTWTGLMDIWGRGFMPDVALETNDLEAAKAKIRQIYEKSTSK
jgi:hypothetical protein